MAWDKVHYGWLFSKTPEGTVIDPSRDFLFEVSKGNVPWHTAFSLFWQNPDVTIWADETLWDQWWLYTYLTSDAQLYASSTDAADTQLIVVSWLDDTYTEVVRTVTLSWQSQIALSWLMFRVHSVIVFDSTEPAWDVYIAETDSLTWWVPDTASKIKAKIIQWNNFTRMMLYTVPVDKILITRWITLSCWKSSDMKFTFLERLFWWVFFKYAEANLFQTTFQETLTAVAQFNAKDDFEIRVNTQVNNTSSFSEYDVVLVDAEYANQA